MILNNEVDFAISSSKIEHRDISWEPIIQDDIYLTVSKEHPLSQCTSLELTQIKDERLIGQIEGYGFRDTIDYILKQEGIVLIIK